MEYQNKTKEKLIQEISKLNQQIIELKKSEDKTKQKLKKRKTLNEVKGRNVDDGMIHSPDRLEEAKIEEIKRCAGTQFDPYLVEKFLKVVRQI